LQYTWKPNLPEDECATPLWWCDPLLKFSCLENSAGKILCGWCGSPPATPFRSIAVPVTVRRVAKRQCCSARVQVRGSDNGSAAVLAVAAVLRECCSGSRCLSDAVVSFIEMSTYDIPRYPCTTVYIRQRWRLCERTNQKNIIMISKNKA